MTHLPEEQKKQRRAFVRTQAHSWRLRIRRKPFVGIRSVDGVAVTTTEAGAMLDGFWQLVFAEHFVDDVAVDEFLGFSVVAPAEFDWTFGADEVAEALRRTADTQPGPNGIPYAAICESTTEVI